MKPEKCSLCENAYYCKGVCRPCYMRTYRQKPDQVEKRKAHHREHYRKDYDGYVRRRQAFHQRNRDRRLAALREWVESFRSSPEYPTYKKETDRARLNSLRRATPKWADREAIREFYKNRPEGFHVDHIVPIHGKGVCGLHVLDNLQYLPAIDNLKKGNKY